MGGGVNEGTPGRWSFSIDRGGTFTDLVAVTPRGERATLKLLSSSHAYADPAVEGMRRLMEVAPGEPFPAEAVSAIRIGTTVATNALLERTGAKTLFITTAGFADALLIGDQARPALFALDIVKPKPLYSGVVEARERLAADGAVVLALDERALARALEGAAGQGFESAAIAFLHSDLDPRHERRAGEIATAAGIGFVSLSCEVSPLPRFLPRAETTVADAYLTPVIQAYVRGLHAAVRGAPLFFMTSAGALVSASTFRGRDAVVSGPAGGVVGVAAVAQAAAEAAVLGFDMGGTSTDVCRFAGALERRDTVRTAGVRLRAPTLDVETVAAGGGSILTFDGLRARVGPASAGADPGPAAYGRGGPATVTDANLVLGRLDAAWFPRVFGEASDAPLDVAAARVRIAQLAQAMGAESPQAAASGFVAIAVEQTAAAIRLISTQRGFDPRRHALVAYGGAAGQIACDVAEALDISAVLCPYHASLLSAWGIGRARMASLRQAGFERPLDAAGVAGAVLLADELEARARSDLRSQGAMLGGTDRRVRARYAESDAELTIPLVAPGAIKRAFEQAHRRLFGFIEAGRGILIAAVEVEAREADAEPLPPLPGEGGPRSGTGGVVSPQKVGEEGKLQRPIAADDLDAPVDGPRLIVRADTQIWLARGWRAVPGAGGLIRLARMAPGASRAASGKADPVTLELFNRRFMGVAEAMGAALERTARSVNIKERLDFSCALFDAAGGLVANAPHMPVHLGSMGASVRAVKARRARFAPGEAFALNNPYAGGTHLPDITVVMPVFMSARPTPAFFVAARGHHADVGGVQPGSMPPFSRTLEEEGVLLDVVPIMARGRFLERATREALGTGRWPARSPDRNLGDLKAQIAACHAGASAMLAMIEAFGHAAIERYMGHVQANAEACVRRAIGRLRNGAAVVPMDGGGVIRVEISVDATAGAARLDFTGSSGQLPSNFNAPASIVDAAALYVFRTLVDDDIPLNAGCLAPLEVILEEGSMLDPRPPAAVVAGNVETSQHIVDALYAALGVMANSQGTMNNFTFGDEERQYYETICGGAGATAKADGASAVHTHMTNSRLTDPEILERRMPVRLESFALRRGSAGPGRRRGGEGVARRIRFLAAMTAALLSTRRDHRPQGLVGGGPALAGAQRLISARGELKELPGCFSVAVRSGDVIEIETPGGGGYLPPPA